MQNQKKLTMRIVSSMAKVFADGITEACSPQWTALGGEHFSFQAAYYFTGELSTYAKVQIESELPCTVRQVKLVPVACPCRTGRSDENFIKKTPGMYPDLLQDATDGVIRIMEDQWRSVWVEVTIPQNCPAGDYPITLSIQRLNGEELARKTEVLTVIGASLPAQTLKRTEWFYGDCLADYYQVPVFSEKHWKIMENFIRAAAERGCNMILTPIFTPPLDTEVGMERTTIQLVDVIKTGEGVYQFGFERLKRWIDLCHSCGIQYFEMAHLFTQWGATAAPKIVAMVDGKEERIFGWDTLADGEAYHTFLKSFLPELTSHLKEWGLKDQVCFHISDEPHGDHLPQYQRNKDLVFPYLKEFHILDALSDVQFYENGLIEEPVCASNAITSFLEKRKGKIWSYYCLSQVIGVSNRLIAMPSSRNRIYGYQIFKYQMEGTLHWGYNFYNTERSVRKINPYLTVDGDSSFPAGDPFIVYPGADGKPEESLRMVVLGEMMEDVRAFQLLEKLTDHETVIRLVEEGLEEPITFSSYPAGEEFLLRARERVNRKIQELCEPDHE